MLLRYRWLGNVREPGSCLHGRGAHLPACLVRRSQPACQWSRLISPTSGLEFITESQRLFFFWTAGLLAVYPRNANYEDTWGRAGYVALTGRGAEQKMDSQGSSLF